MKICPVCKSKFESNDKFCTRDGSLLIPDLNSLVGSTLDGQYQIDAVLGRGGMGVVYQAQHILLGDRVAIKVVPPHLCSPEFKQRFLREGQAARRIHHPNVVTVHDLRANADGIIYMVMEYVEGRTLSEELEERKRFTPSEALNTLEPIASALDAAHRMGVVHRDLKPANIMIGKSADGRPAIKLLDLGLAKIRQSPGINNVGAEALTITGQILGTPYYMPPEQWGNLEDEDADIDGRTDIYSLGIVFYELIAGRKPFNGATIKQLAAQHAFTAPTALHEIAPDTPLDFSAAIARAMAKKRSERQATVAELIAELRRALQGRADLSSPTLAAPAGERIIIKHLSGSRSGKTEEFSLIDFKDLSIGRDPSSAVKYDLYKDDLVARNQCRIQRDEQDSTQFTITDLNSRNGTFVNKKKISGAVKINPGDKVQFGPNGPEFEFDVYPPRIPKTRLAEAVTPTRLAGEVSSPSINAGRIIIKHLSGSKAGQVDEFSEELGEITIGREPSSIIRYDPDKDDLVSFRHAKILRDSSNPMQFSIMDLNSRNGTFVNKQKAGAAIKLNRGDIIQLGPNGPIFEFDVC